MARPIWKGAITFGLVTIPVQVLPATANAERISFRMLRKGDLSPIQYKRVAAEDGKEVAWQEIVKGYEYEKGKYVTFDEQDFDRVELESVDSIAIQTFVELAEINPIFFDKPYYLEPLKGGGGAYTLLREVLAEAGKVGIAKVAMRGRQHLAALKANGKLLVLELMHFATEIAPASDIKVPEHKIGAKEKEMAIALVQQMSGRWEPEAYEDEYTDAVMKLVAQKVKRGGKKLPASARSAPAATNVIDLVSVLQKSLRQSQRGRTSARRMSSPPRARKRTPRPQRRAA